jgi:hypothetical protein
MITFNVIFGFFGAANHKAQDKPYKGHGDHDGQFGDPETHEQECESYIVGILGKRGRKQNSDDNYGDGFYAHDVLIC